MRLEIIQLPRQYNFIDFQVSLIMDTNEEINKMPIDSENIQTDRIIQSFSISPRWIGTENHFGAIIDSLKRVYKEWDLMNHEAT